MVLVKAGPFSDPTRNSECMVKTSQMHLFWEIHVEAKLATRPLEFSSTKKGKTDIQKR